MTEVHVGPSTQEEYADGRTKNLLEMECPQVCLLSFPFRPASKIVSIGSRQAEFGGEIDACASFPRHV
jgi:hypothetical protein